MQQEVIGLVVESPLTDGQRRASLLHSGHNLYKLVLLVLVQFFVIFHRGDVQLMLGLGLWWFKRAGQDGQRDVFQGLITKTLIS